MADITARKLVLGRVKQWLPALFVVLLAVAFRLNGLDWVRQNYDRAFPHGQGIAIREDVAAGRFDRLPMVSLVASINFPNPAGASYFYALLTAIEPSAYAATALNALSGVLVAAIAFNIARRMFRSTWAATAAGILAAVSPWATWVARGAWLQGPIEAMAAITFWLLFNGWVSRRPRHLLAALVWVALCLQTYLVTFGLLAQTVAAMVVGLLSVVGALRAKPSATAYGQALRPLRKAVLIGLAVCAVSVLAYVGAASGARASIESVVNNPNAINTKTRAGEANLDPINHTLRIASGRDYENTYVETDTPLYAERNTVSDLRATLTDVLFAVGLLMCVWLAVRDPKARLLLAWVVLPVVGTLFIANIVMRDWEVHVFYLLLTSPGPYVLAAAPFALLNQITRRNTRLFPVLALGSGLLALPAIAIPWWNVQADIDAVKRFPYNHDGMTSLPLGWQMKLADAWRAHGCTSLDDADNAEWLTSLIGSAARVRAENFTARNDSTIWQIAPEGGDCIMRIDARPVPVNAGLSTVVIPGQKRTDKTPVEISLYRALPAPANPPSMTTNIGWSLVDLQTPAVSRAGETITITHMWRVESLPAESFLSWYYAPFVKLMAADGRVVVNVDGAPSLEGYQWVPGRTLISTIHINLPPDLTPGGYTLEMSLFDPNQKKNAVYFDPVAPGEPVVTIRRAFQVQ